MWIKILCIEYILFGIPTIESTFDVANMMKTATVKDVPINDDALPKCSPLKLSQNNMMENLKVDIFHHQYLRLIFIESFVKFWKKHNEATFQSNI